MSLSCCFSLLMRDFFCSLGPQAGTKGLCCTGVVGVCELLMVCMVLRACFCEPSTAPRPPLARRCNPARPVIGILSLTLSAPLLVGSPKSFRVGRQHLTSDAQSAATKKKHHQHSILDSRQLAKSDEILIQASCPKGQHAPTSPMVDNLCTHDASCKAPSLCG